MDELPREDINTLIINALNMVNLNVTPETYIKDLSGGMKQKLAIVETILQQSKTLFLDEPTAMLDVQATKIYQLIKQNSEDQTVVIITNYKVKHIWNHVDRVILMDYNGTVITNECPEIITKNIHLVNTVCRHHMHGNWRQVVLTFQQQTHTYYNLKMDVLFAVNQPYLALQI